MVARTRANSTLISSPGTKSGGVSWASPNNWATSGSLMPTRSHAICSANWFARRSLIFGSIRAGRPAAHPGTDAADNPAAAGSRGRTRRSLFAFAFHALRREVAPGRCATEGASTHVTG